MNSQEHFLDWVRDAHAMEKQAESMLEKMAARLEHYPDLRQRIEQHIEETREQQTLVQSVIDRYDTSRSVIKDTAGKLSAFGQAMGGMMTEDEVVRRSGKRRYQRQRIRKLRNCQLHLTDCCCAEAERQRKRGDLYPDS